jgi:hypothetical protein
MPIRIVVLDDIEQNRAEITSALATALAGKGEAVSFVPSAGGLRTGTYEDRLSADLRAGPHNGVNLIVADRDLSGYEPDYRGLSEATVRSVAHGLGIPECGYARGERANDFVTRGDRRESCIRLDLNPSVAQFAQRVVAIAEGFAGISERLTAMRQDGRQSPGRLLANLLGKPKYADKISLYSSGDLNRLADILRLPNDDGDGQRRLACFLGYWLWDSVLRYPGVTVGVIPASSYLNIDKDVFQGDEEVRSVFSTALYAGPFAGAKVQMWWRGELDDIVAESGCNDGRALVERTLGRPIPASKCCVEPALPAGYYCMLSEMPVSLKNSKGGLTWFPRGADLARVSTAKIDELGPWLGA